MSSDPTPESGLHDLAAALRLPPLHEWLGQLHEVYTVARAVGFTRREGMLLVANLLTDNGNDKKEGGSHHD